jgi:hypothetical protein
MKRSLALLAAGALLLSSGIATAKSRHHSRAYNNAPMASGQDALRTPFMGPSSTNPETTGRGYMQPHLVPENGGAPNAVVPRR